MNDKPVPKKDPSHKKAYIKPELKSIPLDDEEGLLEYCRGKPYKVQELKDVIEAKLHPMRRQRYNNRSSAAKEEEISLVESSTREQENKEQRQR